MRKCRENEEMERDLLSTFPHFLYIHFLYQILGQIILGRNRCENALQVGRASSVLMIVIDFDNILPFLCVSPFVRMLILLIQKFDN